MRVSDVAKEFGINSDDVLAVLKSLKLKAKDAKQEVSSVVLTVLKRELAKRKITPKAQRSAAHSPKWAKGDKAESKTAKKVKVESKVKGKVEKKKTVEKKIEKKEFAKKEDAPKKKTPAKKSVTSVKKTVSSEKIEKPIAKEKPKKPEARKLAPEPKVPVRKAPEVKEKKVIVAKKFKPKKIEGPLVIAAATVKKVEPVTEAPQESKILQDIEIQLPINVKDLSIRLQQKPSVIIKRLVQNNIFANINQSLSEEIVKKIASDFGFSVKKVKTQEEHLVEYHDTQSDDPSLLKPRAPVVTFMGHVDHGKTSLLDKIRKSNVTDKEHGGITQHMSAYSVNFHNGIITFLDTPGHEAFTSMRARGAHITDLVILVVAADEGIMPQTEEAIDHARAADVPIIVALNKIDRRNADIDRVKKQLADHDLNPEDWGGKTVVVPVSAITGEGIDTLLEMMLLEAELLELKANAKRKAVGIVIEAHLSKGKGSVATVIVQNGTLREGDIVLIGPHYGKIKAMLNDHQKHIGEAGPATPAEIIGLSGVPEAGEIFYALDDERKARDIVLKRQQEIKNKRMQPSKKVTLEDLYAQVQEGKIKELNIILKADVQGSLEAIKDSLEKLSTDEVKLKFIHMGVGDVNTSDVVLAGASNAIIIAFNVSLGPRVVDEQEKQGVDIRKYRIIYDVINDMTSALSGMLEPKIKKRFLARIEIREVFKLSRSGIVAGCYVTKGKVHRKALIDIIRNGEVVFSGGVHSLKRFKDDVRDVAEGFECGITIEGFKTIQSGDVIEAYEIEKIARTI